MQLGHRAQLGQEGLEAIQVLRRRVLHTVRMPSQAGDRKRRNPTGAACG